MEKPEKASSKSALWESTKAIWINVGWLTFAGFVGIVFMSFQFTAHSNGYPALFRTLQVIGIAFLVAGAAFTTGGLGGFLFGIPKILQNEKPSTDPKSINKISIVQNDNLVEISDWLTKIIVGVGLTQLYKIPHFLNIVGKHFSPVFGGADAATPAVISVLLYFLCVGFFAIYLWTRLFFVKSLKDLNDQLQQELADTESQVKELREEVDKLILKSNNN